MHSRSKRTGRGPRTSTWAIRRRFSTRPSGRPTARRSPTPISACNLWYIDLDNPTPKLIDSDYYGGFVPDAVQPDLVARQQVDRLHPAIAQRPARSVCIFARSGQGVPDHGWHERCAVSRFDKNGKYLYFTASTDVALATAGLDMSSDEHRVSRSAYVAVLSKD